MTELEIRRIKFEFDETTPFNWQPANPGFGQMGNVISFIAIGFEKYIVSVVREAIPHIKDPEVATEAELFLRQEGQHANAHRRHVTALCLSHPGLKDTLDQVVALYDELNERESLSFNLAYIANLEATFTPFFKLLLDNKKLLFDPGNPAVASLFLWHFVEEVEHRSSALKIYDDIVGERWSRVRALPKMLKHLAAVNECLERGFDVHVSDADRGAPSGAMKISIPQEFATRLPVLRNRVRPGRPTMLAGIAGRELLRTLWRLALSQAPHHNPRDEPLPDFAEEWFAAWEAGADVRRFQPAA